MKQITGRMTGTEIQIEMEIQALRTRVADLEQAMRDLSSRLDAARGREPSV